MGLNFRRNGVTSPEAYARSAFEAECTLVASAGHGRNEQLNKSAYAIGQFVGAGVLDRAEAEHGLFTASQGNGYVGKDGAAAARATIKSGIDKGMRQPRSGMNGSHSEPPRTERPQPKLDNVPVPDWTPPNEEGKPKFFASGRSEPATFSGEARRHRYYRDGEIVRLKVKKLASDQLWSDFYKVRRPADGAIGWQAKKPEGFEPVPYIGPKDMPNPFDPARVGEIIVWGEGEKDVDTLRKYGFLSFTFGSASEVPDCGDLLRGHHVILCADNDEAGERSIPKRLVVIKEMAGSIRTVRFRDFIKEGFDATDFFEAGHSAEDFLDRAEKVAAADEPPPEEPNDPVSVLMRRFNGKFMLVNEAGKAIVLQPNFDPVLKRRRHDRLTVRDLQTLYMNEMVVVGQDDKGRPVLKTAADIWLKHPERRQFINGIAFDPTGEQQDGVLNLWEGFAVTPQAGDWSLMRDHIRKIICDGDEVRFTYLMGWMARTLQHPAEQGEVAVVMRGGEGSGKGTLAKALMRIVGHHGLAIANAKHLVGNFNAHLRDVIFLFADEAFFAGDRSHIGALKSLITEPHLPLEGKFQNVVLAPNFLHLMMASNEDWVVPASLDARRFFVLEVPDGVKGDHAYFARLWKQMEAGGYGAMLADLLAYNLTGFNVRSVPTTEGLQTQRKLSLPISESWWLDCLERGYVYKSKIGLHDEFGHWHDTVTTELLFLSYTEFAQRRGERRPLIREHLGRFLKQIGATAGQKRNGVTGEQITDVPNGFGGTTRKAATTRKEKAPAYTFGALAVARCDFAKAVRIDLVWDDAHPWQDDDDDES